MPTIKTIIVTASAIGVTVDPEKMLEKMRTNACLTDPEVRVWRALPKIDPTLGPFGR